MILFPTIMHTGNHFLFNLFGTEFSFRHPRKDILDAWGEIQFEHLSCFVPMLDMVGNPENVTVIPLRHPRAVAVSWEVRGMDVRQMCREYKTMIEEYDKFDPLYIPIDSPHREKYLASLNNRLGLDLETDWTPVGEEEDNSDYDYTVPTEHECVERLCADIEPFLRRFY
jgi:hypothetical protein